MAGRFGIVEAAARARGWGPHLESYGQRVILAGLVFYTGSDSVADPTIAQLVKWSGFRSPSVSRVLTELHEANVIVPIGDRSKGGKATKWSIKPSPPREGTTTTLGQGLADSDPHPGDGNPHPAAAKPSPQGYASETEISEEDCALHLFEARGPNGRFKVCAKCGLSPKRGHAVQVSA